jgi:hypothetical protein
VAPLATGGIYVCGYIFSVPTVTLNAGLTYSASVQGTVGVGAALTKITPSWNFATPTIADSSSAWRGIYVPPGNGLNITTTATGTMRAIIYYFQQGRG